MKILFHRKVFKIFVLQFFLILVIVNLVTASSGGTGREIEEVKEDAQEEGESTTDYIREMKEKMSVFGKERGLKKLKYQSKAKKYIGEGSRVDPFMKDLKENTEKLELVSENNQLNDILQTIEKINGVNSEISKFFTSAIRFEIFFEIFKANLKSVNNRKNLNEYMTKLNEINFKETLEVIEFYFEIQKHITEDEFSKKFKENCVRLNDKLINVGINVEEEKEYKEKDPDEIKKLAKDKIRKEILQFFENEKKIKEGKFSSKVKKVFNVGTSKLFSGKYKKLEE